jgi:hypothetical protein
MKNCGWTTRAARAIGIAAILACVGAPIASAHYSPPPPQPRQCTGAMGPVVVVGNLVVPVSCQLAGTKVTGTVTVKPGASLTTSANAAVLQDVVCGTGSTCSLTATVVGRDVTSSGQLTLASTFVADDLTCLGTSCSVTAGSRVHDDTVVKAGSFTLDTATLDEDLVCGGSSCAVSSGKVARDLDQTAGTLTVDGASTIGRDLTCAGTSCTVTGTSSGTTISGPRIGDDVVCKTGTCTLTDTVVDDDVQLLKGPGELYVNGSHLDDLDCEGVRCNVDTEIGNDLVQTFIDGSVSASHGAYFSARLTQIGRNVSCIRCATIDLFNSTVGGNVSSLAQTDGGLFCDNVIKGSLTFLLNDQYFITCDGNQIGGILLLTLNGGTLSIVGNQVGYVFGLILNNADQIVVADNHAGKAIVCKKNKPQPIGGLNSAPHVSNECGPITGPLPDSSDD